MEAAELTDLRDEALRLRTELNDAVAGAGETVDAASISALVFERDRVEAEIRRALLAGTVAEVDVGALAETLAPGTVAVGYRRYRLDLDVSFARRLAPRAELDSEHALVALGGVTFDAVAEPGEMDTLGLDFAPLPGTEREVRDLAVLFRETFAREASLLTAEHATKTALHAAAPRARYLHLATHGYFADAAPALQETGLVTPYAAASVRSLAPMTLCGLALAGANAAVTSRGRTPGILTAEELAGLDLVRCELAVLSACQTNVGIRSAGQGVQSLQAAAHAAGARAAITSLWKVDDEATRALMTGFYERLWTQGRPKAEALWEAKREPREAGAPARDWAGWVLTGS